MKPESAPSAGQRKAQLLLRKLLLENPELTERHGWASERARWAEFCYLLTSRLVAEHHPTLRHAIGAASALELLEVGDLAAAAPDAEHQAHLLLVFTEYGLSAAESAAAITTLREAASQIQQSLEGHLHRFLRHHAEVMLHELTTLFKLSHLSEGHAQQAFILWLQNTCNLPLSLLDSNTKAFCLGHEIAEQDLVDAADAIQLNLGLVDDLVELHLLQSQPEAANG